MIIKTFDVTGFGGGYEATCQKMIWNAVRFIAEHPQAKFQTKGFEGVYGLVTNEGPDGKAFDDAMMAGIDDATGAMHQCATGHARYIAANGYKKWYSELTEHRKDEQAYDFEYEHEFVLPEPQEEIL